MILSTLPSAPEKELGPAPPEEPPAVQGASSGAATALSEAESGREEPRVLPAGDRLEKGKAAFGTISEPHLVSREGGDRGKHVVWGQNLEE